MSYPPYQEGYAQPPYYSGSYPPQPYEHAPFGAPPGPPPPLPPGWIQEWEPGYRRAFFVQLETSHSQWEPPYPPEGGYHGQPHEHGEHSNKGKMLAAGAAGLALGAAGGAFIAHEMAEGEEEKEEAREEYVEEGSASSSSSSEGEDEEE